MAGRVTRLGGGDRMLGLAAAAVGLHLVVSVAHGLPHGLAPVPLRAWQNAFVAVIVISGPPVGLWLAWRGYRQAGGGLVAVTGLGSFVFGTYFHFVSDTPDNVARVSGGWANPFLLTAVLISVAALAVVVSGVLLIVRGE